MNVIFVPSNISATTHVHTYSCVSDFVQENRFSFFSVNQYISRYVLYVIQLFGDKCIAGPKCV